MLKIKDNVNLEELKKLGFEKRGEDLVYKPYTYKPAIWIHETGKISLWSYEDYVIDMLFDLIEAGVVEKRTYE